MLAGKYNMVCDQGSTFQRIIEIKDADGVVFPLTGYTARMQIRRDIDATATLMELTNANGRITINGALGAITMTLTPELTVSLTKSGVYDLEIVKTSTGEVHKVLRGEFRLEKEVTR
jgi:phage gp45-like